MRINDDSLKYIATTLETRHEGFLFHKTPKDGHPSNKHFKLIANLLFYEVRAGDSQTNGSGMMLIEKCVVDVVGIVGQPSRTFSVMFDGDGGGKHYFTASTPADCTTWMTVLGISSYRHLRTQLDNLQSKVAELKPDLFQRLQMRVITKLGHQVPLSNGTNETMAGKPAKTTRSKPKIKHKSKLGSTFYGVEVNVNNHSNMSRGKTNPQTVAAHPLSAKSTFFSPLDVIKAAPSKTQTLGPARAVSATVDELRKKAMTVDRRTVSNHGNMCSSKPATGPWSTAPSQTHLTPSDNLSAELMQFQSNPAGTSMSPEPLLISCAVDHTITDQNQNKTLLAAKKLKPEVLSQPSAVNDLLGIDFSL